MERNNVDTKDSTKTDHQKDRSIETAAIDETEIGQPSGEVEFDANGVPMPTMMPSQNIGQCTIS
jgi:hypothetical protein